MKRKFPSFREFLRTNGKILLESEEVLSEFEKEFPKEIVRADPSERPLEVTEENMQKIFKILNKMFFDEKLKEIPIVCLTSLEIEQYIQRNFHQNVRQIDIKDSLAFYFNTIERSHKQKKCIVVKGTEVIFVNTDDGYKTYIGFAISYIMHEMIHYYDSCFGSMLKSQYLKLVEKLPYDEHKSYVFKEFMKKAIDNDIDVKIDGNGSQYIELGEEAQRKFLGLPAGKIKDESQEKISNGKQTNVMYKNDEGFVASCFFHYK